VSIVTLTDGLPAILNCIRALEADHGPDDWPAMQMRDLTAMRDEIAHLRVALEHAWGELDDLKAQPQPEAVALAAMRRSFSMGLKYWAQADSGSWSQNKKSFETLAKFNSYIEEVRAVLAAKGTK